MNTDKDFSEPEPHDKLQSLIAHFLDADQRGAAVDREAILAEHPNLAESLRDFFEQHDRLRGRSATGTGSVDPTIAVASGQAEAISGADEAPAEPAEADVPKSGSADLPTFGLEARERQRVPIGTRVRYFGDYELLEEIARGGMGVVYKARQNNLNRVVALKMILAGELAGEDEVQRFKSEAEAAAQLDHPGIVPIFEIGEHNGQHYFSMGFVDGESLADKLREGPLPPREAAALMVKICDAVAYAHNKGVIHRDLKPANVLIDQDGQPRVTDFGLAKRIEGDSELTRTGQVIGTPAYMPPEQAAGTLDAIGPAADVYALGAVLYTALAGRPPFQSASIAETLIQVLERDPVPLRQLTPDVPRDLETICLKCLRKESRKRYESAKDLGAELQRFLSGEPIRARPVGQTVRAWRWCRRNRLSAALAAATVTFLVAGAGVSAYYAVKAKHEANNARIAQRISEKNEAEAVSQRERADHEAAQALKNASLADTEKERADAKAIEALASARRADQKAAEAQTHATLAEQEANRARRHLYVAHINLAQRAWEASEVSLALDLLNRQTPETTADQDLRGFEWHYLHKLCHAEQLTLEPHTSVDGVAFSNDGKRLVTVGRDSGSVSVKIWDAATGRQESSSQIGRYSVRGLAFGPKHKLLAVGHPGLERKGAIRLLEASTGNERTMLHGHDDWIRSLAFSPDGRQLASGSEDKAVKIWDLQSGETLHTIQPTPGIGGYLHPYDSMVFSPDGRLLAAVGYTGADIWDTATGEPIRSLSKAPEIRRAVAFSPDGARVAIARFDAAVEVWDVKDATEPVTLRGHTDAVRSVAFSPNGKRLASGSADRMVRIWDFSENRQTLTFRGHDKEITTVAFSPDGKRVVSADDGVVKIWDATSDPQSRLLRGHRDTVPLVAFRDDGQHLVSVGFDQRMILWESATGAQVAGFRPWHGWPFALGSGIAGQPLHLQMSFLSRSGSHWTGAAVSGDGLYFAAETRAGGIAVWETATGHPTRVLADQSPSGFTALAFSADNQRIASARHSKSTADKTEVVVWDVATGERVTSFGSSDRWTRKVVFSPDTDRVSWAGEQQVTVGDAATGEILWHVPNSDGYVTSLIYSPDGQQLIGGTSHGSLKIWGADTGTILAELAGHSEPLTALAITPDGKRLASGGEDGIVKLWQVTSREPLLTLPGRSKTIRCLAFSRDGTRLSSSSSDGLVRVWDATPLETPDRIVRMRKRIKPRGTP